MIEVVNRQRKRKIDAQQWKAFGASALNVLPVKNGNATVVFVSDRAMALLNRRWRGKRGTTDVLSFPSDEQPFERSPSVYLGDVVISIEQAARQAKQNRMSLNNEIEQLILHGLIHLCGHDHATDDGEMNRLELKLRKKLGI
ncbi:MAG TPA: rRNA maturation RNase YbeY [Pyrinomonadaceae bacterium]|nr:rRNA maturation RNase YbeY [Pyrinomonadaceae bacterium]